MSGVLSVLCCLGLAFLVALLMVPIVPQTMAPMGEVVHDACEVRAEAICMFESGKQRAVFVFRDEHRELHHVCKDCADQMFYVGKWIRI